METLRIRVNGREHEVAASTSQQFGSERAPVWQRATYGCIARRRGTAYARAVARWGEQGTIEMVSVVAYYTFQSMVLNTARTPVPPGAPALKPFPK